MRSSSITTLAGGIFAFLFLAASAEASGRICESRKVKSFKCGESRPPPMESTAYGQRCQEAQVNQSAHAEGRGGRWARICSRPYPQVRESVCHAWERRCSGGGGQDGRRQNCRDNADCQRRGRESNRDGARQSRDRRRGYQQAMDGAEQNINEALSGLADLLDRWARDQNDKQNYQHDSDLVSRATPELTKPEGKFTEDEADSAKDSAVRQYLGMAAASREIIDILKPGERELAEQEKEFDKLADEGAERETGLGTITDGSAASPPAGINGSEPALAKAKEGGAYNVAYKAEKHAASDISSAAAELAEGKGAPQQLERPGVAGATGSAGTGAFSASSVPGGSASGSLRELLQSRLAGKADSEALGATGFQKTLGAASATGSSEEKEKAQRDLASTFGVGLASGNGRAPGFQLGAPESEAEIRRIVSTLDETHREGAELFPSADSADLFRRVHLAHRSCHARQCVK